MKKVAKIEYGITIVKPWSKQMYDHNDKVITVAKSQLVRMWDDMVNPMLSEYLDGDDLTMDDLDWLSVSTDTLQQFQKAVTCYSFGFGYSLQSVQEEVLETIQGGSYHSINRIFDELSIPLEPGFIGFK